MACSLLDAGQALPDKGQGPGKASGTRGHAKDGVASEPERIGQLGGAEALQLALNTEPEFFRRKVALFSLTSRRHGLLM